MHVEQSFGILVRKFKIFKMLEFSVADSAKVTVLAMKLQNFCVDHGQNIVSRASINRESVLEEHDIMSETKKWYSEGKHAYISLAEQLDASNNTDAMQNRNLLVSNIRYGRFVRPAAWELPVAEYYMQFVELTFVLVCAFLSFIRLPHFLVGSVGLWWDFFCCVKSFQFRCNLLCGVVITKVLLRLLWVAFLFAFAGSACGLL